MPLAGLLLEVRMVLASQKLVTAVTRFSTNFLKANHSRWEPPALNDCFGSDEAPMAEVMLAAEKGVGAMTKLDQLHLEKSKKFAEICALVACELGYGELATIESEARHHVEREAENTKSRLVFGRTSDVLGGSLDLRRFERRGWFCLTPHAECAPARLVRVKMGHLKRDNRCVISVATCKTVPV